jgi:hypothetical protein
MKTILVAVDLSNVTMKVVKVAVHLAKPFQSKIILIHAVEPVPQLSPIGTEPVSVAIQETPTDFTQELSRLQEMISHVGLESTKLELEGPPVELILAQGGKFSRRLDRSGFARSEGSRKPVYRQRRRRDIAAGRMPCSGRAAARQRDLRARRS